MTQEELDLIISNHALWLKSKGEKGRQANFDNAVVDELYSHDPQSMHVKISKGGSISATGGIAFVNGVECLEHLPSHFTKLNFREADLREAIFNNALFYECDMSNVNLSGCDLSKCKFAKVNLKGTKLGGFFEPLSNLSGVTLSHCDLKGIFLQHTDFSNSDLSKCNFLDAKLYYCKFDDATVVGSNFSGSNLWGSSLNSVTLDESNFDNAKLEDCNLSKASFRLASFENTNVYKVKHDIDSYWSRLGNAFKSSKKPKHIGCKCSTMYGNEKLKKTIQEEAYVEEFSQNKPKLYMTWLLTSDCGRSMGLWLALSTLFIILFSTVFYTIGTDGFVFNEQITKLVEAGDFIPFVYYSVVTFTTLGFGDITPKNALAMWVVICEVVVGFIMLGLLISILANKVASRS